MADNTNQNNVRNDEIDLLDLFRRMGRGISKMIRKTGTGIVISLVFMLKRWYWLAISVILAVALSYFLKYSSKSLYSSEMVVQCGIDPLSDIISYVNKLHVFCQENNKNAIASAFELNKEKIDVVNDIQAFWIIDKGKDGTPDYIDYSDNHNVLDTLNVRMKDRFAIRIKINSPKDLNELRDGIFKYVEHNNYFIEQNNFRISQTDERLKRISYDIIQLDSLQKFKYYEEAKKKIGEKGGQLVFLQDQKTQLVYDEIYKLYDLKQYYEKQKMIYPGIINLLSDFTVPAKPKNSGSYYAKYLVPIFFSVCLLILILLHNRNKLKNIFNKYK